MGSREQVARQIYTGPRTRREYKKRLARYVRRLAKKDPEGAPIRRPTKGWSD